MTLLASATDTSPPDSKVIAADNLVGGYPGNVVWEDANFEIDRGEFVAVIGPNGAGKTTLFRLILGLQRPISGSIRVLGAEPSRGNPHVGYVPQRHTIDTEAHIQSIELVRLGFSGNRWGFSPFSHDDTKAAISALEAVGAVDLAHRHLGELSGGELQRVFLAEALASSPDVLLLDEPLSNLDMKREGDLVRLVNDVVRSRNVTALLIGHNINPLLPYLDRVIYIANGRVASGRPDEVLTSESLSRLYGMRVEVLRGSRGNLAIVGIEGHHGDQ